MKAIITMEKTFEDPEFQREWEEYRRKKEHELYTILDELREKTKHIDMANRFLDRKKRMAESLRSGTGLGSLLSFGGLGGLGDDYYTDTHYAANLVAHTLTTAYLLNGKEGLDGKVIEIGFGKKVNDMHLPLLSRLGYDALGLEIDEEAVRVAKVAGYNAELIHDFSDIQEKLKGQDVGYIIGCRMFELAPLMFGEGSEVESPDQLFQMMAKMNSGCFDDLPEQKMGESEAMAIVRDFFNKVYQNGVTRPNCVHVQTTSDPFIPYRADLEKIGYKIIGLNADNSDFIQARHVTVFHR